MYLGRVFDTDGDSVSIDDLIKSCISDINLFSKSSLKKCKLQNHNAKEWIDSYMEDVYVPVELDFTFCKSTISEESNDRFSDSQTIMYADFQAVFPVYFKILG